jgi:CPA2 family monovalent cation:H+ antiporter-2
LGGESLILPLIIPLVAASLTGLLARRAGLSIVAGYVAGGIIVGPILRLVDPSSDILSFLSELGIILIAFEIGLTLRLDFFSRMGTRAAGIVGVEVVIVSLLSYLVGIVLSLKWGDMLILIFIAVNTSTAVTFKMLEERHPEEGEEKKLVLGVGAFEDVVSILGLTIFPALSLLGTPSLSDLVRTVGAIVITVTLMIYLGIRILVRPLKWVARKGEEIFLAVSLAVVLTYSYIGIVSGLSEALGAFVAGLVVSKLEVSKTISERFHSLRDLSALIFFSSIGASLPSVSNAPLVAAALGTALLVVFIKFFGFSISSWITGLRLEESFRLGLYMLAISEFGVIVAKDAVESGVASQTFYLTSVIALAVSAFLSSCLIKFEQPLSEKMAGLIPIPLRFSLERFFTAVRESVPSQSQSLVNVKRALWELTRRVAIISFVVFAANLAVTFVTPILSPVVRAFAEATIALSALIIAFLIAIRMKGVFLRLVKGATLKMFSQQRHIGDIVASILYAATLCIISIIMIIISYTQIERFFSLFVGKELASPLIFILITIPIILLYRYIYAVAKRLEEIVQITE